MLLGLEQIRRKSKVSFSLHPVILDQKQPGFKADDFQNFLQSQHLSLTVLSEDTYSIVKEKTKPGKSYCGLCSRLRRGIFYTYAQEMGFTKIALGHHRDDLNQTVLMNMFYGGKLESMPPVFKSDDGNNTVIRPMVYVKESDIEAMARDMKFPIIPCNLCGSQAGLMRQKVKGLLRDLEAENHNVGSNVLASLANVKPSHLLDRKAWDFENHQRI